MCGGWCAAFRRGRLLTCEFVYLVEVFAPAGEPHPGLDHVVGGGLAFAVEGVAGFERLLRARGAQWAVVAHFDCVGDLLRGCVGRVGKDPFPLAWWSHTAIMPYHTALGNIISAGKWADSA